MLAEALEEGSHSHIVDVESEVGTEHDDAIEVGVNMFKVFDHLVDNFDKLTRNGAAALGNDASFDEPGRFVEFGMVSLPMLIASHENIRSNMTYMRHFT